MRRRIPLGLVLLATLAVAAPAHAVKLEKWPAPSRYVTPADASFTPGPPRTSPLQVFVLLPDGYRSRKCWPVLWLLHGHGEPNEWINPSKGDIVNTARGFRGIIVMPDGGHGWYTNWWNGGRRGPAWERYHLDELIPMVTKRLNICPDRRDHSIAGLSMGGDGAFFYASQRPGYFGSAASFSGILDIQMQDFVSVFDLGDEREESIWGNPQQQAFYWTGHNPRQLVDNLRYTRLYLAVGDGKPAPGQHPPITQQFTEALSKEQSDSFVAAAQAASVPVTYTPRPGVHSWSNWRQELGEAIRWNLFKPVSKRPSKWTYKTVEQQSAAWGFKFSFRRAPSTLETFAFRSGVLSGQGSGRVRITAPDGARFTAKLPFRRHVPARRHH